MKGFIGDIDWVNAEAQKYWSIPASYSEEKRKSEVVNAIYSGDYYGALKVDGYYQRLIKDEDGNCFMVARNKNVKGEVVNKIEWVPQLQDFMTQLPNGTVLLSECYLPGHEGSKILLLFWDVSKISALLAKRAVKSFISIFLIFVPMMG